MSDKKISVREKLKTINVKKAVKTSALGLAFILIIFMSFYDLIFDFDNFDFEAWLARTALLSGIMIFGILMGNSIGTDSQKEKVDGLFQIKAREYTDYRLIVESVKSYFSEFWLWYKNKKLIEKKVDYLIDNQFESKYAKIIVNSITKEDLVVGKFIIDENDPNETIYIKEINGKDIKIKKCSLEQSKVIIETLDFTLDTFGESYYLSLYDDGDYKSNEAEKGKRIAQKIKRDKRNNFIVKITSSMIISIVWGALTIRDFTSGDENARLKAWLNLLSRIFALVTSFVSGYATSVVNVRDQARAIENKTDVLKDFKTAYDNKEFRIETYEEMIEREYQEQEERKKLLALKSKECDNNNVLNDTKEHSVTIRKKVRQS